MECITVLKRPDLHFNTGTCEYECNHQIPVGHESGKNGRLCSHDGKTFIIGVLLVLMLVSFASQLVLHLQVQELRQHVELQNRKIDELIEAKYLEQRFNQEETGKKPESSHEDVIPNREVRECTSVPHFYLKGGEDVTDVGVFQWKPEVNANFDRQGSYFGTVTADGTILKIEVKIAGMYFVFSQIKVTGRQYRNVGNVSPAVGFTLYRSRQGRRSELASSFLTQDERGARYYGPRDIHPVDTLTLNGMFILQRGDTIFIEKRAIETNSEDTLFDNTEKHAHFGAFLVERNTC